ncbi:MAG: hypothetical protein LIO68_03260, partial [Rikenellaceae bacterium]|nr:hypothetical protein [Rikenellaceae bacterium]
TRELSHSHLDCPVAQGLFSFAGGPSGPDASPRESRLFALPFSVCRLGAKPQSGLAAHRRL